MNPTDSPMLFGLILPLLACFLVYWVWRRICQNRRDGLLVSYHYSSMDKVHALAKEMGVRLEPNPLNVSPRAIWSATKTFPCQYSVPSELFKLYSLDPLANLLGSVLYGYYEQTSESGPNAACASGAYQAVVIEVFRHYRGIKERERFFQQMTARYAFGKQHAHHLKSAINEIQEFEEKERAKRGVRLETSRMNRLRRAAGLPPISY